MVRSFIKNEQTIKHSTLMLFRHGTHDQPRTLLPNSLEAYNFALSRKTLNCLTPYEYICNIWKSQTYRLAINPVPQIIDLNTRTLRALYL